jgi:two-component system, NarL family, sensor kinase
MTRVINTLFCICIVFVCRGQVLPLNGEHYADSLQLSLQSAVSDSVSARDCFLLAEYWAATDSTKAWQNLMQGKSFAKQSPYLQAMSNFYEGELTAHSSQAQAAEIFMHTDTLFLPFNTSEAYLFRARSLHNYAVMLNKQDDLKAYTALILEQVIPLAQRAGDSVYTGKNYMDIAIAFKNVSQYKEAEAWLLRAISTLEHAHAPAEQLVPAYHTIAENYVLSGNIPKAVAALDSMKALLLPYPEAREWLDYYAAEAMTLTVNMQFDQSLLQIDKGLALAQRLNDSYGMQRLLLQKFYALFNKGSFPQARDVMFLLSNYSQFMALANNRLQMDYGLAETFKGMGDMTHAYEWMKRYSELSDSVNNSKLKTDLAALEVKYHEAEHLQQIKLLQSEKQQAVLTARSQRLIVAVLVIIVAFGIYYYVTTRRQARLKMKELQQQQSLQVTQALLEGEERERSRVARDLHDGLGGMLAGVKIKMTSYESDTRLHTVIEHLDQSMNELRRIARNMMPESLLRFGLETALRDLCESMMTPATTIEFQAFAIEKEMPVNVQVAIYRIVQEALSNAVRHAEASKIILQCSQNDHMFFVTLEDNGKGFDTQKAYKGIGLQNIRNRVDYMNGKLEISSVINEGTVINIELNVA